MKNFYEKVTRGRGGAMGYYHLVVTVKKKKRALEEA